MFSNLIKLNLILNSKQKKNLIFLTGLMLLSVLAEVFTLNIFFTLLSYFANPIIVDTNILLNKINNFSSNLDLKVVLIGTFLISFLLKSIITITINWSENKFFAHTERDIALKFFKGYIFMPKIFHIRTNISETIKVITFEIQHLLYAIRSISSIIMEVLILIGLTIFLFFINFDVTILTFCILLIFSFFLHNLNSTQINFMGKQRIVFTKNRLQNIIEGISGANIFKLTGTEKKLIDEFKFNNDELFKTVYLSGFRLSLPKVLFEVLVFFLAVFFIIIALENGIEIANMIPILGVFLTAGYRMVPSFGRILSSLHRLSFSLQAVKKIYIDYEKFTANNDTLIGNKENASDVFKNFFKLSNISFSYEKNQKNPKSIVLENINLNINKGDKIGIIGKSGSGKSTLIDIIMGFLNPFKGKIFIDSFEFSEVKKQWQKIIGCVPQDVFILDKSLAENIAFGFSKENIDYVHLDKCLKEANLEEFRKDLKFGINSVLGEKGARLSGGQRQRIGIARALYTKPEILIFDEVTSALDEKTEKIIINEIFKTYANKTILFVSHNINNLRYCNKIIEIKNKNTEIKFFKDTNVPV